MIKVENIDVWGFEHAIRGMRNPMNSWDKSDSYFEDTIDVNSKAYSIGETDLDLMQRLYKAGTEHRKYLRQIFVSMDITAPLYWWKEFDTYKIGVTRNSCSTMHKVHSKEFDINDFSHDYLESLNGDEYNSAWQHWINTIRILNRFRDDYNVTKDKTSWRMLIEMLPASYNQRATITMNYENVMTMINQRAGHKLDEWNEFVEVLRGLPYVEDIRSH